MYAHGRFKSERGTLSTRCGAMHEWPGAEGAGAEKKWRRGEHDNRRFKKDATPQRKKIRLGM